MFASALVAASLPGRGRASSRPARERRLLRISTCRRLPALHVARDRRRPYGEAMTRTPRESLIDRAVRAAYAVSSTDQRTPLGACLRIVGLLAVAGLLGGAGGGGC